MTVSAKLKGAPVQIRWVDNGKVERPSSVKFDPTATDDVFSYAFVDHGTKKACGHTLRLKWRSPSGAQVTLMQGDVLVSYRPVAGAASACS
jgi:hypothetical protein